MLCDVVIAYITRVVVVAGTNVVAGHIHNNVTYMIVTGCFAGQLLEMPLLSRPVLLKILLSEGMVHIVQLYGVGIAVVVPAVVVALANILVVSTVNDANLSIVTGRAVSQLP